MMNNRQIAFAVLLVISGSFTTLMTKWSVKSSACGVYDCNKHGARYFIHPYVISLAKFIGEFSCFLIYLIWHYVRRRRSDENTQPRVEPLLPVCNWFVFLFPALCSLVAIVTVHIGLNLTFAATSQLLRGTSVLFNGLLSMAFLAHTVLPYQWVGMVITAVGLVLIGAADLIFNENTRDITQPGLNACIAGGLLILLAEIIAATQAVLEQRYIRKYNVSPLFAVGLEGLFGVLVVGPLLLPMYYIRANLPLTKDPTGRLENVWDALMMMGQNWQIMTGVIAMTVGGTIFNYAGMTIIKEQSAVTKSVLDASQTVPTWMVSTVVGWMNASVGALAMQISASVFVIFVGPAVYFDNVFAPFLRRRGLLKERSPWEYQGDDFNHRPRHPDENDWGAEENRRVDDTTSDVEPLVA